MNRPPDWKSAVAAFPAEARAALESIRSAGGRLTPDAVSALLRATGRGLDKLMVDLLPLAATYAVAPISGFPVGAIAAGPGPVPTLHFGANFEFAGGALGFAVHAEQSALNHAWLAGESAVTRLAVTDTPCGHCRQFFRELAHADELHIMVRGQPPRRLGELLPAAFGPEALGVTERLLRPHHRSLAVAAAPDDPLVSAARDAAERSHAPYSQAPAGCALQLGGGGIQDGRTAECAAYNPTLPALASAVAALVMREGPAALRRIMRIVVVEKNGPASQRAASAAMAACVAPKAGFDYLAAR